MEFVKGVPVHQINPSEDSLVQLTSAKKIANKHGVPLFHTKIHSRSAAFTEVIGQSDNDDKLISEMNKLYDLIDPKDFLVMKVKIGESDKIKMNATYTIHKEFANKVLMMRRNFFTSDHKFDDSDILSMDYPLYPERKVVVDPRPGQRISYLLSIDYYGEAKMSLLRMGMEIMRADKNGLGLHAGSKSYKYDNKDVGLLIFGLSGTGKTTLTTNTDGPFEEISVLQDDINFISADGIAYGTEKGFYVKTDNSPEHKEITEAVLDQNSIMENVFVNQDGAIEWKNFSLTKNGRAIVERKSLKGTSDFIDLPHLDYILFNTRRAELPPIGRLVSPEQGAAYYGLGESVITSAEDPALAGQMKRVVGFDPFILGDEAKNINRIQEILKNSKNVECFVVNTGYVGTEENDITVNITLASIICAITKKVNWVMDEALGFEVPEEIDDYDYEKFKPRNYYGHDKFQEIMNSLRVERKTHLSKFNGINQSIIDSV